MQNGKVQEFLGTYINNGIVYRSINMATEYGTVGQLQTQLYLQEEMYLKRGNTRYSRKYIIKVVESFVKPEKFANLAPSLKDALYKELFKKLHLLTDFEREEGDWHMPMTLVASAKLSDYTSLRQDELHANLVDYRHIFAKVSNDLHEKLCLAKIKADSELLIPYRNKMKVGKAMSGIFAVPEISDRERWVNGDSKLYEKSYTPRQGWDESCKKMVENGDANLIIPAMFEDESAGWEDSGKDWDY